MRGMYLKKVRCDNLQVTSHRHGEVVSKWRSLIPSVKLLLILGAATPGHLKPPYSGRLPQAGQARQGFLRIHALGQ